MVAQQWFVRVWWCVSQVSRKEDKLWRNKRKSRSSSSANSCCSAAGWFPMPLEQHKCWDVFCELLCSVVSLSGLLALRTHPAALYLNLREFFIQAIATFMYSEEEKFPFADHLSSRIHPLNSSLKICIFEVL